jgi:hypothetical protein
MKKALKSEGGVETVVGLRDEWVVEGENGGDVIDLTESVVREGRG